LESALVEGTLNVLDAGSVPLLDLLALDDSALGPIISRLRREADSREEIVAAFDSAV
jgi:FXSXX-COOH protein